MEVQCHDSTHLNHIFCLPEVAPLQIRHIAIYINIVCRQHLKGSKKATKRWPCSSRFLYLLCLTFGFLDAANNGIVTVAFLLCKDLSAFVKKGTGTENFFPGCSIKVNLDPLNHSSFTESKSQIEFTNGVKFWDWFGNVCAWSSKTDTIHNTTIQTVLVLHCTIVFFPLIIYEFQPLKILQIGFNPSMGDYRLW